MGPYITQQTAQHDCVLHLSEDKITQMLKLRPKFGLWQQRNENKLLKISQRQVAKMQQPIDIKLIDQSPIKIVK